MEHLGAEDDHTWSHQDIDILRPREKSKKKSADPEFFMYVDGAYKTGHGGSGGVVLADAIGNLVCAEG